MTIGNLGCAYFLDGGQIGTFCAAEWRPNAERRPESGSKKGIDVFQRLGLALLAALLAAPLAAGQGLFGAGGAEQAETSLLAGWAEPDGRRVAGLKVDLAPGWKTYWRSPGDAGIPPQFDWSSSENLADLRVAWPAPTVFETFGLRTIGYKSEMLLPLALTPKDPTRPIRLRLSLFYGVCEEICIPAQADLSLEIRPDTPPDGEAAIRAALGRTPDAASLGGLVAADCAVEGAAAKRAFTARLVFDPPLAGSPVIVAEGPDGVWFGPVDAAREGDAIVASGDVETTPGAWIDRADLRLTILAEPRALVLEGCPPAG